MESSSPPDEELHARVRQQEVVTELGQEALETDDLDQLMRDASVAVAETLGNDYCGVLELLPTDDEVFLRQGVGLQDGLVGSATVPTDRDSQAGYTLRSEEPVIVDDLRTEERFTDSELLTNHDVVSGISVVIGSLDDPWGILGTHTTEQREFTEHDANFVKSVANVLASAIENECTKSEREEMYGRISDAFFALDEQWRFTHINERAHELFNPEDRSLVGKQIWEEFPDVVEQRFKPKYERAMREQETVAFEEYYPDPLDTWFEVRAYPSESGLSVYFRDVTDQQKREQELQRTERRFEAIFEDPDILVGLLDPDGTVRDINQTAMDYIDADLDAVTGELFWETPWWGEGDDVRDDAREWTERAAAGEYVDFEADLTRPDGQRDTLSGVFRPVTDDDGDVVSVIVSDRGVTERKEQRRQIEQSERRYQTLVENFPNGAVGLFDEELRYTAVGGQLIEDADIDREERVGHSISEIYSDELVDRIEPYFLDALDGVANSFEVENHDRYMSAHTLPVRDANDEVFAGMVVVQDVTEQREREQYLEDVKARLEAATEAGAVGTFEWNIPEDELVTGTPFAETFGIDREAAAEGVPLDRFISAIHEDDRERVERKIEEALESCGEYKAEYRVWNDDGELRWVVARGHVECDEDGKPVTFPGALTDITERKRTELALQRNRNQLESLFELLPVGVVVADADGELVNANDTAKEIWGGDVFDADSVAEYEKYPLRWADTGEPMEPDEMPLARVLDGEEVTEPEILELDAFDDERRIIRVEGMPIRDEGGEVVRGVITLTDITERREAQRRVEKSERRYRALAENFPNGAVALVGDDMRYRTIGGSPLDVADITAAEGENQPVWEVLPSKLAEEIVPRYRAALDGTSSSFEIELRDRFYEFRVVPVRDDDGEVFAALGMSQDVTETKESQRKLEESERRYRTLAENFPNGAVSVYDHDLRFTLAQGSVMGDVLPAREEVEGKTAREVYPPDIADDLEPLLQSAVGDGDTNRDMFEFGGRNWQVWATPLRDGDGDIFAGLSFAQDVTEQKQHEQRLEELVDKLETSNERLEQFAYAASHDLQEPLRMVSSYLQLLERRYADDLDDDAEEFIEFAVDGADRMRDMIEGLLEYSRVDTRGDPLEPVDLDDVLAYVRADLQVRIEETNAEIAAESLPSVEGDADQLRQLFQNLLDNAIEYSGDDPPRIDISAERNAEQWVVSVHDAGIGIDPEDADRVFEVFQSLHAPDDHSGTGIGLPLCERIVERHGGDIWVDSEPGEGTTFSFTLPTAGDTDE
jgi:PAS domain S-box-containing protein